MNFPAKPWVHKQQAELIENTLFEYDIFENTWSVISNLEFGELKDFFLKKLDSEYVETINKVKTLIRERDSDVFSRDSEFKVIIHGYKALDSDLKTQLTHDFLSADSDAILKQANAFKEGDSDLNVKIVKEVHDRLAGDSDLKISAAKEKHDRLAGDSDLTIRTTKEIHDRHGADSDLLVKIHNNDSDIAWLTNRIIEMESEEDSDNAITRGDHDSDLKMIYHDFKADDSDLKFGNTKEIHDRLAGDSDLTVKVNEEKHDRLASDSDLLVKIIDNDSDIAWLTNRIVEMESEEDSDNAITRGDHDSDLKMTYHDFKAADSDLTVKANKETHYRSAADSDLLVRIIDNDSDIAWLTNRIVEMESEKDSDTAITRADHDSDFKMTHHDFGAADSDITTVLNKAKHDITSIDSDFYNKTKISNTYYVNDNKQKIQETINKIGADQGNEIILSAGAHGGALVIDGLVNNAITAPANVTSAPICELPDVVTIQGATSTRVRFSNVIFQSKVTIDGTLGRHYFKACTFNGGLEFVNTMTNWVTFEDCNFSGGLTVPATFGGTLYHIRSQMENGTLTLNQASPLQVIFVESGGFNTWPTNAFLSGTNGLAAGTQRYYLNGVDIFSIIEARLDSDEAALQATKTHLENLLDSEYAKNRQMLSYIESRLDSDESQLQFISLNYVKTVNGIKPDIHNNVSVALTKVYVGSEDLKRDSIKGPNIEVRGGNVWIIAADSDSLNDGRAYVFDSENLVWRTVSGFDFAQADARYVNLSGDQMIGTLYLAGDPTLNKEAANKHYVDSHDSDLRVRISIAENRLDSDQLAIQAAKTYLENRIDSEYVKNREMLAYIKGRLDSDELAIQTNLTRLENLLDSEYAKNRQMLAYVESRLDSDELAIQTNLTRLENLLDSEYVKNRMILSYVEGRLDSDEIKIQNIQTQVLDNDSDILALQQNLSNSNIAIINRLDSDELAIQSNLTRLENLLDSEYVKNREMLAYIEGRLDSDELFIQNVHKTLQNLLDSEYLKNAQNTAALIARLDSDSAWVQELQTELQNLLDSEYAKNRQMLAYIEGRLDSDESALQAAKTHLENLLDSEYNKNRQMLSYLEGRLDSDELAIQTNLTYLENKLDSEYAKNRQMLSYIEGRLDSDELFIQNVHKTLQNLLDSEYLKNAQNTAALIARLDSDQAFIQAIHTDVQNLLDSEYDKNRQMLAYIESRLDSDELALQFIHEKVIALTEGIDGGTF